MNETTWEIQLVSDELKGIQKSEYHNNTFWFIKYDWSNNKFILSKAYDSIYELLCETADGINLSGNSNVEEWKNYKLLPEIIKQKASKNLIMLLLYLRARFEFLNQDFFGGEGLPNIPAWYLHQFWSEDDYVEENPYFRAILESFPTAEFVAG